MLLQDFKNWLIQNNYKINTAKDYEGIIERLCKKENISMFYNILLLTLYYDY